MRYPKKTKGYFFYNSAENKMVISRNTVFLERELVSKRNSGRKIDLDEAREPQYNVGPELELERIFKIKLKITLLKKHKLFVYLVGFTMNLRDIMDFS